MARNEKGSVLTFTLVMLTLFCIIATSTGAIFLALKKHDETTHLCRERLLNAENFMLASVDSLLALNPLVKILNSGSIAIQAATLAAAILFPAAAPLLASLALDIEKLKEAVVKMQLSIIHTAEIENKTATAKLWWQLSKALRPLGQKASVPVNSPRVYSTLMQVEKNNPGQFLSEYQRKRDFKKTQILGASWALDWTKLIPQWLISTQKMVVATDARCTVGPKEMGPRKDRKWNAILKKDKSLSRPLLGSSQFASSLPYS